VVVGRAPRSGIVLISHDRRLLERISRGTVWLDRGVVRKKPHGTHARARTAFEAVTRRRLELC
jgi:ATPase subunit of ABC transporter with duplicated ATPase domains